MQGAGPQPGRPNYLDFELEIGLGSGREYPVTVLRSPAGEAHATMHFPFDELALDLRLSKLQIALLRSGGKHRRAPSEEEQAVQGLGRSLFEALFSGRVRTCYDVSLREAAEQDKGLRLKLRIRPPELSALPWELLYDPDQAEYVCLSRQTPIVRYLESPRLIRPLTVSPPLRILGMVASPQDLPVLDIEREKQRMERATQDLRGHGLLELEWLPGQTWRDLQEAMWGGPWHVFHFIGHGGFDIQADEGFIALADDAGRTNRLNATRLGRLLADHPHLRLVLLNACEGARGSERDLFSSTAYILVHRGIPAVVAMQYEITDGAAIEFARAFYRALAHGMAVDEAVVAARKAIDLAVTNTVEWGTPVLYMRTPDGVLFHVSGAPQARAAVLAPPADAELERRLEQRYTAGLSAYWLEDWDEACGHFQAIVDERPGYQDAADKLAEAQCQKKWMTLYERALAARQAKNWKAGRSALEALVAEKADYKDAAALLEATKRQVRLAGLYAQALRLHQAQEWQAVVNVFAQIAALDPDYPDPEGIAARAREEMARQVQEARRPGTPAAAARPAPEERRLARGVLLALGVVALVAVLVTGGVALWPILTAMPTPTPTLAPTPTAEISPDTPPPPISTPTATPTKEPAPMPISTATPTKSPTSTYTPSDTPIPPTDTPIPPTDTPIPPTDTPIPPTNTPTPHAGATRVWQKDDSVMVFVPAGEFRMGTTSTEMEDAVAACVTDGHSDADCRRWFGDEGPQHTVLLDAFWIDRTEVTNAQYRRCVDDGVCSQPRRSTSPKRDSYYGAPEFDDYPVIWVNWEQANAYCTWAGKRLPSEAEWEMAARGTDGLLYPWGSRIDCSHANYADCVGDTTQVASYPRGASPYGALDMGGNVWEFVADWYREDYYASSPDRNPEGPDSGERRVLRGGSWRDDRGDARAARRGSYPPLPSSDFVGFRCARSGSEP